MTIDRVAGVYQLRNRDELVSLRSKARNDPRESTAGMPSAAIGVEQYDRARTNFPQNSARHPLCSLTKRWVSRGDIPLNGQQSQFTHYIKGFGITGPKWKAEKTQALRRMLVGKRPAVTRSNALPCLKVSTNMLVGELRSPHFIAQLGPVQEAKISVLP